MNGHDNVIPFPVRPGMPITPPDPDAGSNREAVLRWAAENIDPAGLLGILRGGWGADSPGGFAGFDLVQPRLLNARKGRACYVVRVDLDNAKPPIWRRLRLASDLTLDQVHVVLQTVMGWTDSHLHQFQMGPDVKNFRMQPFLTPFDLTEGALEGILESEVRLDQVLTQRGHRLFYEYDFGDAWHHTVKLEKVEPWVEGDPMAFCVAGRRACPPEDVGGISGYHDLLAALDGDIDPAEAEWMEEQVQWLGDDFDPAAFDVQEVNEGLTLDPLPSLEDWHPGVSFLLLRAAVAGGRGVQQLVNRVVADGLEPDDDLVERAVLRYRTLLRAVGPGIKLTAAGYLPPAIVASLYHGRGMNVSRIGAGNREDMTRPVLTLRQTATALGLLRKAKGKLTVTKLGQKLVDDPRGLFAHISARLPLGREHERDAGMLAWLFIAAGDEWWDARVAAAELFEELGWQGEGDLDNVMYRAALPTTDVLDHLIAGAGDRAGQAAVSRALLRNPR